MCVPDQKTVHPLCHHEWYDWAFCAHHGTDDLGHPTPCLAAAADAPAALAPHEEAFCPVCFVASARSGWICSVCSSVNYTGALWHQVECATCGDAASLRAGHVACRLCVAVAVEPGQPTSTELGQEDEDDLEMWDWDPESESEPSSPAPQADFSWDGDDEDDEMEDDLEDLDVDEELEPIDDVDALYDGMAGVVAQTHLFGPAPRPGEMTDDEAEVVDRVVVTFGRRRRHEFDTDESDVSMTDSE